MPIPVSDTHQQPPNTNEPLRIASASLPLFNQDGYLLQGGILLPLTAMNSDVVHPWGPRPLLRDAKEPVLMVKCLEYEYDIRFPAQIYSSNDAKEAVESGGKTDSDWKDFDNLSQEERNNIEEVVEEGRASHM